ncbi:TPA: DUF6440 family protein [Clostridium perfringens]|mgnify:FL=1|uniref:DUF6440 domain-containing protein n=1 Tax=Clostridium perfringens TaxID=1502 RepID=A0A127EH94_CLOPF|nr:MULTISPECIES: DUF6440 family protein [Clostridium]AMN35303.1 hypothetical protein JFP838_05910 [Clostridium perfringens]EGT4145008.1 hypothetical protein [Clostridium perfringens]EIW6613954.1 hypothetical protein [Clostridium perfringens]EJT5926149.1 hypothetical protein [Clostridium perfringens]EJT6170936.1 hypothetical protein [Clostridium perfringens]
MFSKKEKRFENKFIENLGFGTIIVLVDKKTGVNYLLAQGPDGCGLTPLLDSKGNVVVEK